MFTKPLDIGNFTIHSRTIAAPMAGLSLPAFRKLLMELGCGLAYTEMVSAEGVVYANERTKQYYENTDNIHPHAVQFFTSKPDMLVRAIEIIESKPPFVIARSEVTKQSRCNESENRDCHARLRQARNDNSCCVDLYDLNMGCPVKKVVKKGSGSALMKTPELAADLVKTLKRTTAKPVTVKIRAGWDETSINCVEFAKAMEDAGADAITLHPRTRSQEFRGHSNWKLIAEVKNAVKIPVIGNGDIKTKEDAQRMMEETGCDAIMIGRAAYRNPWIFKELGGDMGTDLDFETCPHVASSKKQMVLRYIDLLQETRDERHVIYAMRAFLSRFAKGHEGTSKFMTTIHTTDSIPALREAINGFGFNAV